MTVRIADVAALFVLVLFRRGQEVSAAGAYFGVEARERSISSETMKWASTILSGGVGSLVIWHLRWSGLMPACDGFAAEVTAGPGRRSGRRVVSCATADVGAWTIGRSIPASSHAAVFVSHGIPAEPFHGPHRRPGALDSRARGEPTGISGDR